MSDRFMTLPEIRRAAKRLLPPGPWGYAAGGAETETTLRRNRQALRRLAIRQRVLVDVRQVDLTTTFLGLELPMPVAIAPMGGLVVFHPQGDCEMARGAGPSRTLAVVSGVTGWPVEEVAQAASGPLLFSSTISARAPGSKTCSREWRLQVTMLSVSPWTWQSTGGASATCGSAMIRVQPEPVRRILHRQT